MCPILSVQDWIRDPRLPNNMIWWVENVFKAYMKGCEVFCYIPEFAGITNKRVEAEKELWRRIGNQKFVVADRILDYLLNAGVK